MASVSRIFQARIRDLGGFSVRRVLPHPGGRSVGPFVFLDHMGPVSMPPGQGMDVPPHPHIGLATLTYLYEGEIRHRDSAGYVQTIRPGDVNWMSAGRGVVHSERSTSSARAAGASVHGLQSWIALPRSFEETPPAFRHHPASKLPVVRLPGAHLVLIAGRAFGKVSPAEVHSPMFHIDAQLDADASLALPPDYAERAVYIVSGTARIEESTLPEGTLALLTAGETALLEAAGPVRAVLFGGEPLAEPRHIWWNFVSSSPERIERAKADWKAQRFPPVPGETEFIPLPEH